MSIIYGDSHFLNQQNIARLRYIRIRCLMFRELISESDKVTAQQIKTACIWVLWDKAVLSYWQNRVLKIEIEKTFWGQQSNSKQSVCDCALLS